MSHVLFISTAIPPFSESQTIRNVFFLRGLAASGFRITIITIRAEGGDASLQRLMPECDIIRTAPSAYQRRQALLQRLPGGRILQWLYGIWGNFFLIPDSFAGWDGIILRHLEREPLREIPDVVISASGSYTAHLAAARLSQRYRIPFVAELGDPWTYNPIWPATFFYRVLRNRSLELGSITKSDAVVVTTSETADLYKKWLGSRLKQASVITMGYSHEEFADAPTNCGNPKPVITYVGVAYRTGRNIIPIIEGLAKCERRTPLSFQVVGAHSASFRRLVTRKRYGFTRFLGKVPYSDSLTYIKSADLLVVIGNPGGLQVPGKIFMYLASGKPILYISQDKEISDAPWQILKKFPGTKFCRHDSEAIFSSAWEILSDYDNWRHSARKRLSMPQLHALEWNNIGARFAETVTKVIEAQYVGI